MSWIRSSFCEGGACVEVGMNYRKSSFCSANGCVEVGADWTKSASCQNGSSCVEVRRPEEQVIRVRDSKDPDGPALTFTADEWTAFTAGVRNGEFDL